jgi:hypothetical protein
MCRSIKVLRKPGESATAEDVEKAALQFVKKISGFQKPSQANQADFQRAVREVAEASQKLLIEIETRSNRGKAAASGSQAKETTQGVA